MLYIVNTKVLTMLYTTEIDTGLNPRCQSYKTLKVAIQVLDSCRLRRGRREEVSWGPLHTVPRTAFPKPRQEDCVPLHPLLNN
jgi:hypothetical protein